MGILDQLENILKGLPPEEIKAAYDLGRSMTPKLWVPNPGPQTEAYYCEADELFYGGEAGGGKTDLGIGLAINEHSRGLLLRRLNSEVEGLIERMVEIIGHEKGLKRNAPARWKLSASKLVMFGGVQHLKDMEKYRGVPKDLIFFDELPNFLREQYEFIIGWARSTRPGQRVRVVAAGNAPTTVERLWVIERWAPWLDPNHPNPALPGELRWFTNINGKDTEVDGPGEVMVNGAPLLDEKGKPVFPKSRTFIPAELADNPDLEETGYADRINAMPEAMKRSMKGDFTASLADDEWQVFPTAWVDAAMARWKPEGDRTPMSALSADIAQGGADNTVIVARHETWFSRPDVFPGSETTDGPTVAGLIFMRRKNGAEVIIDMGGGWGGSTMDHLKQTLNTTPFLGSESAEGVRDRHGVLKFLNMRAAAHWGLREALDPDYGQNLALPPDPYLKQEMTAIRWKVGAGGKVQIEDKADIKQRIGRSPDRSDAVIMAHHARGATNSPTGGNRLSSRAITSGHKPRR